MDRTRELLKRYDYRPKKSKGQHFLVSEPALERIAAAARLTPEDTVIEIGPGTGNLTRHLVAAAGAVIAIELEPELAAMLRRELPAPNLTILDADALAVDFEELAPGKRLKLVANIPYNITSPLLFKLLDARGRFSELLILVQREVATRLCAAPGGKDYGILAAQAQLLADCAIVFEIGPEAFVPRPKVSSALLRLALLPAPRYPVASLPLYRRVVRAAFTRRRKTLRNSFGPAAGLPGRDQMVAALIAAGIDPGRRPETVSVEEFARLCNRLAEPGDPHA